MRYVLLSLVAFLIVVPSASAAQRFASPSGAGNCSTPAQACSLTTAIGSAAASDEVIVGTGTYNVNADIQTVVTNLNVHGDTSGPMPNIVGGVGATYVLNFAGAGARVSYLKISDVGIGTPLGVIAGEVSRVDLTAEDTALSITGPCSVKDSLLRAAGSFTATAMITASLSGNPTCVVRNVTAIAAGGSSTGIQALASSAFGTGINLDAKNVIAQADQYDFEITSDSPQVANATITNSNFDQLSSNGGSITTSSNQTATALFVNAAGGDYREAAGSPTIDAGVINQVGPLDLAGNLRTINGTVDIGAYEFIPSPASTPTPTPTPTPAPGADAPAKPSSKVSGKVKVKKKKSKLNVLSGIKFTCAAACTVTGSVARSSRTLGKVTTSVKAGATAEVTIALSKKGAAALRKAGKLKVKITASAKDTLGRKADASRSATIRAPRRK